MNEVYVYLEAKVYPTENLEKVKKAIENMIWDAEFTTHTRKNYTLLGAKAVGKDSLLKISTLLRKKRILDATRSILLKGLDDKVITFYLNKQVAYMGKISFSESKSESPLDPIKFQIHCDDPKKLIYWLTQKST